MMTDVTPERAQQALFDIVQKGVSNPPSLQLSSIDMTTGYMMGYKAAMMAIKEHMELVPANHTGTVPFAGAVD